MDRQWTEADVAAYLDGELHGAEEKRIAQILESDAEAQACAARLSETDALLREAFAAPLDEPLSAAMKAMLEDDQTVVPFGPRRAPARPWVMPAALAASVALLVGFASGSLLAPRPSESDGTPGLLAVGPAAGMVSEALDTAFSGQTHAGVTPVASFRVASGSVCREFETTGPSDAQQAAFGIACTDGSGWQIVMAARITRGGETAAEGYMPASGIAVDAALPVLDALGAGGAMTAEEERQAMADNWR